MPDKLWPLLLGLLALFCAVMAVGLWAALGGVAGKQRGFVIRNLVSEPVLIAFEDGQSNTLDSNRQATFVLKRKRFPQTITATSADGEVIAEKRFEYSEIAAAEFRWDVDRAGFFPTQDPRAPVP